MLRTAEEILEWAFENDKEYKFPEDVYIAAINEARKEAIEECAEKAKTRTNDESTSIIVDKQSILSLIKELK